MLTNRRATLPEVSPPPQAARVNRTITQLAEASDRLIMLLMLPGSKTPKLPAYGWFSTSR
jgi:hypothetical protein